MYPYSETTKPTLKDEVENWFVSISKNYPLALTLTLKQTNKVVSTKGVAFMAVTTSECRCIAKRFIKKLNRQVFGKRAAEKYGKKLNVIPVVEGDGINKRLHLHFAIGGLPNHITQDDFERKVEIGRQLVAGLDIQYKIDSADSGWLTYIAKEVGKRDTDNILWDLMV